MEKQTYAWAWRNRQRLRLLLAAVLVLVFVYLFSFDFIWPVVGKIWPASRSEIFFVGLSAWAIISIVLIIRVLTFRCPRCGKFFNLSTSVRATTKNRTECIHCHLPIGAEPSDTISN
jgi:hypothetical protein